MTKIDVVPFEKEQLIEGLKSAFPNYKIHTSFGSLQVRTKSFALTGNVQIKAKPKKGEIITQTNRDMLPIYLLVSFPVGLYVYFKRDKQKAMEKEVADKIQEILT